MVPKQLIDALSRVIFLNGSTPIVWTDASGSRTIPVTYISGQNGNVTLSFGGSTPVTPANISYMIINSTAQYHADPGHRYPAVYHFGFKSMDDGCLQ